MCSEVLADVLFQPCLHMVVCDSMFVIVVVVVVVFVVVVVVVVIVGLLIIIGCAAIMKKCVKCRVPIESIIPREVCCGGKRK